MTTLAQLQILTGAAIDLAHTIYPDLVLDRDLPVLSFKSSRALGRCRAAAHQVISISYNLPAVAVLSESVVVELVAHEVAHAVAATLHADLSHGWRWKSICSALGGDAKRVYQCGTEAHAALKEAMAPAKRVRYFEWNRLGVPEWLKKTAHARRIKLIALANRLNQADSVALRYGSPTGRETLSNVEPGAVAAIVCDWGSN